MDGAQVIVYKRMSFITKYASFDTILEASNFIDLHHGEQLRQLILQKIDSDGSQTKFDVIKEEIRIVAIYLTSNIKDANEYIAKNKDCFYNNSFA